MRNKVLIILASLLILPLSAEGKIELSRLRCEYSDEPLNVDTDPPGFTWEYEGSGKFTQESYCLILSADYGELSAFAGGNDWKNLRGMPKKFITLQGGDEMDTFGAASPLGLESFSEYYWMVIAYSQDGKAIRSGIRKFETGIMKQSDWTSKWITDSKDLDEPSSPALRKSFTIDGEISRARLYIGAAAYSLTKINGEKVYSSPLATGFTHYGKRNLYTAYDVKGLLKNGENVISAVLGNGFYNIIEVLTHWGFDKASWRNRARMTCELHLDYADGRSEIIRSDSSWKCFENNPYLSNNIYSGDNYDARKEVPGWDMPGFDDGAWADAAEVDVPSAKMKAQTMGEVKAFERIRPLSVKSFGDTVHVFRFEHNITGICEIDIEGPEGTFVELRHGEMLDSAGRLFVGNVDYHGVSKWRKGFQFQTDTYIMKGQGRETWSPSFTYHGFNYVEVATSNPVELDEDNLTAVYLHTEIGNAGHFDSSNEMFNKLVEMTRRTYLNNLTSIPTDCPTREKNGWTADAQLAMDLGLLNFDGASFYDKWMDDFIDCVSRQGRVPGIVPTAVYGYADWIGPVWDATMFIVPYTHYCYYGDKRIIEKMWDSFGKYLAYLKTRETPDGTVTYGIGDWSAYSTRTNTAYTSSCYYYYDYVLMAKMAEITGRDPSGYMEYAERLKNTINRLYFDSATAEYAGGTQTSQAIALYLGLVPEGREEDVARVLNDIVVRNDYFLDFGTIGSKTVLRMLTKYGYVESAYKMADKRLPPSWGAWIEQGFTTLAETWTAKPDWASLNHVFLGDVTAWYVQDIAGLNYDESKPGYRHFIVKPHFVSGLDYASAEYHSVSGKIKAGWKRKGRRVVVEISVPVGTSATLDCGGKITALASGHHRLKFSL